MLVLGNTPVLTSVYQVMAVLQRELKMAGSHLLRDIVTPRYEGQDISFTCPFHKNGMESKPSCGITTVDKQRGDHTISTGTFSCFTCKTSGDVTELVSHCFGYKDGGVFGKKWILERFNNFEIENRQEFFKKLGLTKPKNVVQYVTESELETYRFTHPYMYKRGLTDELIDIFDVGYDKAFQLKKTLKPFECITFPIKDEHGNVLFIARRSIKSKFFHYPHDVAKPLCFLYEAQQLYPDSRTLWIVESLFNALTLYKWNIPCIALLGTGSKEQIEKLQCLDYRKYVICTDGDEAGYKASEKLYTALHKYKLIERIDMPDGKDVNDFRDCKTVEEFLLIKEKEVM